MTFIWVAGAWLTIGLAAVVLEKLAAGHCVTGSGYLVLGPFGLVFEVMYQLQNDNPSIASAIRERRRTRQERLEADYRETLRLIEWKPRELTPLEELAERIALERSA